MPTVSDTVSQFSNYMCIYPGIYGRRVLSYSNDLHVHYTTYRIAGKFGGELNLALWRIDQPTAKLKIRQYLIRVYTYVYTYTV